MLRAVLQGRVPDAALKGLFFCHCPGMCCPNDAGRNAGPCLLRESPGTRGMPAFDCRHLAEALLPVALAAGRVQMAHRDSGVSVESKADNSPVTIADRKSEEIILEALARAAPGIPVIAEEAVTAGRVPAIGDAFFLVDPLDGTKGYIKGRPEFTINVTSRGGPSSPSMWA
jgi:hypothetical protein